MRDPSSWRAQLRIKSKLCLFGLQDFHDLALASFQNGFTYDFSYNQLCIQLILLFSPTESHLFTHLQWLAPMLSPLLKCHLLREVLLKHANLKYYPPPSMPLHSFLTLLYFFSHNTFPYPKLILFTLLLICLFPIFFH